MLMRLSALVPFLLYMVGIAFATGPGQPASRQHMTIVRMIGHRLLLSTGDSLSRVMPVEQEDDGYVVRFAVDIGFNPDRLVSIADSVMRLNGIERGYLVEVRQCATREVVHSYMVNNVIRPEVVACSSRALPKDCYLLFITIQAPETPVQQAAADAPAPTPLLPVALGVVLIGAIGLGIYFRKRTPTPPQHDTPSDRIVIGRYLFDRRNMLLRLDGHDDALTSKEADLLTLLHAAVNTTVERDVILRDVWEDEGVYVGRTLDVFISRLRKKLEADPDVRILNIRGVGYRLVVGGDADAGN